MKFEYIDNHIIADVNGKHCLIDTGSPFSLGDGKINIDGKIHFLNGISYMGASLESIAEKVGTHLDALIGGDILSAHEGLFVWTQKMEVHFSTMMGGAKDEPSLEFFSNIPIIQITINSKVVKAYIDTGAKQSYIDSTMAEGLSHEGEVSDFYPTLGMYTAPLVSSSYLEPKSSIESSLKFAVLPQALSSLLSMTGCKAILGNDWLKNNNKMHFQINYRDKNFSNY